MPEKIVQQEFSELFIRILFPAFLTVAVGVAVDMKNNSSKVSLLSASLSLFIGVAVPYLLSGYIAEIWEGGKFTVAICITSLLSEKLVKFLMYKFDIDTFLTALLDYSTEKIKSFFK